MLLYILYKFNCLLETRVIWKATCYYLFSITFETKFSPKKYVGFLSMTHILHNSFFDVLLKCITTYSRVHIANDHLVNFYSFANIFVYYNFSLGRLNHCFFYKSCLTSDTSPYKTCQLKLIFDVSMAPVRTSSTKSKKKIA